MNGITSTLSMQGYIATTTRDDASRTVIREPATIANNFEDGDTTIVPPANGAENVQDGVPDDISLMNFSKGMAVLEGCYHQDLYVYVKKQ